MLTTIGVVGAIVAPAPKKSVPSSCAHPVQAKQGATLAKSVWQPSRWRQAKPSAKAVRTHREQVRCAAGAGHRKALRNSWQRRRSAFYAHRRAELAKRDINHRWTPHWAPDWSGPTLPMYIIAALAEKAGDYIGADVPGWTMAEMTKGESARRPGSAGVDAGGTRGYGLWAITWPFANSILARHGWGYEDMWNPVRNAIAMAEIYRTQGLRAWYGDGFVTHPKRHYRGKFDLRLVLGGKSFRQALHAH